MYYPRNNKASAIFFSLVLHAAAFALANTFQFDFRPTTIEKSKAEIMLVKVIPTPEQNLEKFEKPLAPADQLPMHTDAIALASPISATEAIPTKKLASMAAPPPPTAEEWTFAANYTNKNSKGYRYSWGQQVRSMMGTAVEGSDQGVVRFRIEISPNGKLAKLETLWTTSAVAEHLARKAIESMQPLPPTPTGKPLIFERTISFTPYASDSPPSYKEDCLPDPPAFRNPFVWDGKSPQIRVETPKTEKIDPQALEECLRQLPQDSIEAEMARDRQAMERWGWKK